jgi:acyl-CoA reductase-like NAD-dependent aldehyde dehydrogenase
MNVSRSDNIPKVYYTRNGREVPQVSWADASDVDEAVKPVHAAWPAWKSEREVCFCKVANVLREHAEEFALLAAYNARNPVGFTSAVQFWTASILTYSDILWAERMKRDASAGAHMCDHFAGVIPMIKGETIPVGITFDNGQIHVPSPYVCVDLTDRLSRRGQCTLRKGPIIEDSYLLSSIVTVSRTH